MYKVTIMKSTEIDHYTNGCDPETYRECGIYYEFRSFDLELVKRRVENNACLDLSTAEINEDTNCLELSRHEDDSGIEVNESYLQSWKKNTPGVKIYLATYVIKLDNIQILELNANILK
jgi:hypothetical protein